MKGRTYSGYNVWSEDTTLPFETISDGKYLIRGFTNQEIRHCIGRDNPDSAKVKGQISREFVKLRAHGLIRKIPHSRRYLVSDKGRRIMGALIESKRKIYLNLRQNKPPICEYPLKSLSNGQVEYLWFYIKINCFIFYVLPN